MPRARTVFFRLAVFVLAVAVIMLLTQAPDALAAAELLVRNTPQLASAERLLPPGPAIVCTTAPTPGDPAQQGALYVPGDGRYPGVLVLPGLVTRGWRNPQAETLARSLAKLGLAVYVPDLPGLKDDRVTTRASAALKRDVQWFAASRYVSGGRVALFGVCAGASLAILAAGDGSVRGVVALDPYARLRDLVEAATTGVSPGPGGTLRPFAMASWAVWSLAESTAYTVHDPASRTALLRELGPQTSADPLAPFGAAAPPGGLSPAARAWWRLWANRSPAGFGRLYRALPPGVRDELAALSPADRIDAVRVPVLILDPAADTVYPPGEGRLLVQGNPKQVELTVTTLVNHVTPDLSGVSLPDLWRLVRFAYQTAAIVR